MSAHSFPPLITAFLFALLGLGIFLARREAPENRAYALWCLTTVYWQLSWTVIFSTSDFFWASRLVRIGYTGIIFIPIAFYHFVLAFVHDPRWKQKSIRAYLIGCLFAFSVWLTNSFISGVYTYPWGYYPKASYLHAMYLAYLTYLVADGLRLLIARRGDLNLNEKQRTQYTSVIWAAVIYLFASIDFAVNYGLNVYPFGFIFTLLSLSLVAYAILHHQLLDIRLILRDTTVNIVTGGLLAGATLAVTIPISTMSSVAGALVGVTSMGLLMAIAYDPIRRAIQPAIDRIVFANRFGYLEELSQLPNDMLEFTNLNEMLKFLVTRLKAAARLENVRIFMYDPGHQNYQETLFDDVRTPDKVGELSEASALLSLLKMKSQLWTDADLMRQESQAATDALRELKGFSGAAFFPVNKGAELLGVVVLGQKQSGEQFNQKDLKILEALRLRLENFLGQAMVITQEALNMVKDSHDMKNDVNALKVRITWRAMRVAGWKMDLEKQMQELNGEKDPGRILAAVNSLKQQAMEWFQDAERSRGIEDQAVQRLAHRLRNWAEYGRVITEGFRGSRTMEAIEVGHAAKNSVERWQPHAEKKGLQLSLQTAPNLLVWGERSLVEQVIENLIDNAIKATAQGKVEVFCRAEREGIVVEVKDSGCGIPPEDLATIFEKPFYQGRGRENLEQSTGVGLYLVAQYARSLGGKVWAESQVDKGSSFFVQLPKYNQEGERSGVAA